MRHVKGPKVVPVEDPKRIMVGFCGSALDQEEVGDVPALLGVVPRRRFRAVQLPPLAL
jgi:hypothetical protein